MGSDFSTVKIRKVTSCSICKSVMSHPVSINCGHSYCKSCIQSYYCNVSPKTGWKMLGCPLCSSSFSLENLRPNKELETIIDMIKGMEVQDHDMVCEEHEEKLNRFCEDDSQLLCWRCHWEDRHKGHTLVGVKDVYQKYKEKIQNTMTKLRELQENHQVQIHFITSQINAWKDAVEDHGLTIKSNFKNLQSFLQEEEKFYLWRLENEEEQMLMRLKGSEADLQQTMRELNAKFRNWRPNVRAQPRNCYRCDAVKLKPLKANPLEVHTKLSVILDPSTAHPDLALSKGGRLVTYKRWHRDHQASAKRFYGLPCVLGCEGFTSGRYYFEVSVENAISWDVGVCLENVQRGFNMKKEPEFGFWTIKMSEEDGLEALTSTPTPPLHLSEKPQLLGVFLDYEAGVVSFYSVTTGSHIFTFPKASLYDSLRPFFQVYQHSPLYLPAINNQGKK